MEPTSENAVPEESCILIFADSVVDKAEASPVTVTVKEPVESEENAGFIALSLPDPRIMEFAGFRLVEAEKESLAGNPWPVSVNEEVVAPLIDIGDAVTDGVIERVVCAVTR